ncbi:hypothetical protein [Sporosarcina cyprini]|nr:hypothetical protein [Sporosarcina cyprini]MCG3088503.1 hypothetical protein [Sporosarcina cyprini]
MGHKDVQTTLSIYAHLSKDAKDGVVDKFTNYLIMQQKTGTDLGTE